MPLDVVDPSSNRGCRKNTDGCTLGEIHHMARCREKEENPLKAHPLGRRNPSFSAFAMALSNLSITALCVAHEKAIILITAFGERSGEDGGD
ncbi:hypothetical protein ZHAS_00015590 [Anopheles sinensis]|uniref:Uncharacterized protein n=1 Tax=Anopheles sinensis TaxID=74873 RepID=A0A084WBM4_ANOSI|nr:hypothetical protein ZHAS_00015590 [Anopheles sinensis]